MGDGCQRVFCALEEIATGEHFLDVIALHYGSVADVATTATVGQAAYICFRAKTDWIDNSSFLSPSRLATHIDPLPGSLSSMPTSATLSQRPYRQPPALAYQVWLGGGQVAFHTSGHAEVLHNVGLDAQAFATVRLPQLDTLFQALAVCGLPIIGVTALQTQDDLCGRSVPWFMAWHDDEYWWGAKNANQRWQMIAHGAHLAGRLDLQDLADHIANALEDSQARLRDLCIAYATQLAATSPLDRRKPLRCFSDSHSQQAYLNIHGLFWQMGTLRDLLAGYAAAYVFHLPRIGSFAGLVKAVKRMELPRPPLAEKLLQAAESGEWITVFTAYRNLFTHTAPLQSLQGTHYVWQDTRLLYGRPEPQIYYPLPADPETLARERSAGGVPTTSSPASSHQPPDRNSEPDALDYLAGTLDRFVQLADLLAATSPVKPDLPVLTDKDILHIDILDP